MNNKSRFTTNKETIVKYKHNWYKKNEELTKGRSNKRHLNNRDEIIKQKNKYYKNNRDEILAKQHKRINKQRKEEGLPLVGEGWVHQAKLRNVVSFLFPKDRLIENDRLTLNGLELDIHLPGLKLAFEYQGVQHYVFMPYFFKSYAEFEAQQLRDQIKIKRCEEKGIKLIHINYKEEITEQLVLSKIKTCEVMQKRM